MKHVGDISALRGAALEPVDVIVGGSPCQDLSTANAGRRGLSGERSGLFMEQVRITKELREEDRKRGRTGESIRPRYFIWENVKGAFSSGDREDFRAVLEEIARIADPTADVPRPKEGTWEHAGVIVGDGWSVAWRLGDAQFWGVPQHRDRIMLIADFGGTGAAELLFEQHSPTGDAQPVGEAGQGTAGHSGTGDSCAKERVGADGIVWPDVAHTLRCRRDSSPMPAQWGGICVAGFNGFRAAGAEIEFAEGRAPSMCATMPPNVVSVHQNQCGDVQLNHAMNTLSTTSNASGRNTPICMATAQANAEVLLNLCPTLNCNHEQPILAVDARHDTVMEVMPTMMSKKTGGTGIQDIACVLQGLTVRRLTPLECERLQGFPDYWTLLPPLDSLSDAAYEALKQAFFDTARAEGKARLNKETGEWELWRMIGKTEDGVEVWENTGKPYQHKTSAQMLRWRNKCSSDSARYNAIGNSIALPQWRWLMQQVCRAIGQPAALGSLFDGIGGFPLVWEEINGPGSCKWASEINPFCVAVTIYHFGEEG